MKFLKKSLPFDLHSNHSKEEIVNRIQALEEKGSILILARTEVKITEKEDVHSVYIKRRLGKNLFVNLYAKIRSNDSGTSITGDVRISDATIAIVILFIVFASFMTFSVVIMAAVNQDPMILLTLLFFAIFALVLFGIYSKAKNELPNLLKQFEAALK